MLTGLHLLTAELYRNERFNFIRNEEGLRRTAYLDEGIPHIGIGFNLRADNVRDEVFAAFGINPDNSDLSAEAKAREQQYKNEIISVINGNYSTNSALQSALNDVMNRRANDSLLSAISDRRSTFEFRTDNEAIGVFDTAIFRFETEVNNRLGFTMPESKERVALVSLAYNGGMGMIGPKLSSAIANDNRAEAWFEIRYNSNGDRGHATRRYTESNMFNLYDAVFNEEGAKEVMRMYLIHKRDIENYERTYRPPSSITTQIYAAKNYLIATFGEGRYIRGDVIVGKGLDSYAYKDGNPNESIEGTVETDLIFGEAGDDYIYAYNGNDIVYGGEGDDHIYGGYGEDIINGGAGNNILNGGTEYDTYKINSQDKGQDTIQDDEGDGCVKLDGAVLGGGTNANTVSSIYYTDGVKTATGWIKRKQSAFSHQLSA